MELVTPKKDNNLKYLAILPMLPLTISIKYTLVSIITLTFVLFVSTTILSLLNSFLEKRLYSGLVLLLSVFVFSIIKVVLISIGFKVVDEMGVYFSIIPVNASILYLYEYRISKNVSIVSDWIGLLTSFILILVFSLFRELFGTGKINLNFIIADSSYGFIADLKGIFYSLSFGNISNGFTLLILPSAGFIFLGLFIALLRFIKIKMNKE